jgi:hypothetical protein
MRELIEIDGQSRNLQEIPNNRNNIGLVLTDQAKSQGRVQIRAYKATTVITKAEIIVTAIRTRTLRVN